MHFISVYSYFLKKCVCIFFLIWNIIHIQERTQTRDKQFDTLIQSQHSWLEVHHLTFAYEVKYFLY